MPKRRHGRDNENNLMLFSFGLFILSEPLPLASHSRNSAGVQQRLVVLWRVSLQFSLLVFLHGRHCLHLTRLPLRSKPNYKRILDDQVSHTICVFVTQPRLFDTCNQTGKNNLECYIRHISLGRSRTATNGIQSRFPYFLGFGSAHITGDGRW